MHNIISLKEFNNQRVEQGWKAVRVIFVYDSYAREYLYISPFKVSKGELVVASKLEETAKVVDIIDGDLDKEMCGDSFCNALKFLKGIFTPSDKLPSWDLDDKNLNPINDIEVPDMF